jgi:hypothetical protein
MLTRGLAGLSEFIISFVEKVTRGLGRNLANLFIIISIKIEFTYVHVKLSYVIMYVCLYAKLLHIPAANSIVSISLYAYSLMQSFIWACAS